LRWPCWRRAETFRRPAAISLAIRDIRPYVEWAIFYLSIFCFLAASVLDLD